MAIDPDADKNINDCQRVLSAGGRLTTAIPGFSARESQVILASAIAQTIENQSTLVAEAGTGTGKTFAYLIPCLLSGKKTVISTATKTLQDQLFYKDLPVLVRALGLACRVQNLKGRANYICRHRVELHANEGYFDNRQAVQDLLFIREKLPLMKDGERSELPEISEDSPVWPHATSTTDNCLGSECAWHKECFLMKARKKALEADVVVINHHLFFADSRLKEDGFGELLPGADVLVFDEAHQLAEIAENFQGERLGTRQLKDLLSDLITAWPVLDLANRPFKKMKFELDQSCEQLILALPSSEDRLVFEDVMQKKAFQQAWQNCLKLIDDILNVVADAGLKEPPAVLRAAKGIGAIKDLAVRLMSDEKNYIRWVERFKQSLVFHCTPVDVSESFKKYLQSNHSAFIFTSATLTLSGSFECFLKSLALEQAETLILPSPFDYSRQALLYLPRGMPDTTDDHYYDKLIERALPLIDSCGGRSFILFTSHKALKRVALILANQLKYPLLIQGDEAKHILLARFRELGNAVLLGTATFWEGVDVKGEALSCVIIDKLPFASPVDPVMKGKMNWLKSLGLSAFDCLTLPEAVLALKQGAGRLIRDENDRGVLMIADPRLTGRGYGKQIFSSLPPFTVTRDEKKALNFITEKEHTS